jgi:putative transcriptional regulator
MTTTQHLDDSTLMSFAAGSLPAALAVVAAAHLAVCPRCRDEVSMMEMLGGTLLGDLPGASMLGQVPAPPVMERRPSSAPARAAPGEVPAPLARLIGDNLDAVAWRWVSPGSWLRRVPLAGAGQLHLYKCASNVTLPEHAHEGSELTMVLRGTQADSTGLYRPGDICDLDESVEHAPVAGADGCICVVAQDHRVRFRSMIVRLARPWHGM